MTIHLGWMTIVWVLAGVGALAIAGFIVYCVVGFILLLTLFR